MYTYQPISFTRRAENKPSLKLAFSEEDQRRRGRQFVVSIQMTFISWSLEFVAGVIIMTTIASLAYGASLIPFMFLPDMCVSFLAIPASYLVNDKINRGLVVMNGWYRGIIRAIFPDLPYKAEKPMELQSIPPKSLGSFDNNTARGENSTDDNPTGEWKPVAGCITKETNPNLEESKRSPMRGRTDSLNLPRIQSPPKLDPTESHSAEGDEDIEVIASDYLTVAEMRNTDVISTIPENNWM